MTGINFEPFQGGKSVNRASEPFFYTGENTMSKTYGYARCSTNESKQDINRQIKELKAAGAEDIIFEYEHGDAKVKEQLQTLLDTANEGDTIVTLEVSRLSRSTKQLCEIVEVIKQKRLRLVIVGSITVDCRNGDIDPMSQAFIQMSAVFSELELSIIRARVKSGMANAKAKGKKVGRPVLTKENLPSMFLKHYPALMDGRLNVTELARVCGLSRPTVYKYLRLVG
jgi:DNA invertase Pin-like site-specific DNA recombinase